MLIVIRSSGHSGSQWASSLLRAANISTFFPKNQQGLALGLNAGLGNFGVTTMQILIPLVMTAGVFGFIAGDPMTLVKDSGTLIGSIPAGTDTWIQNGGWVWLLFLVPLAFAVSQSEVQALFCVLLRRRASAARLQKTHGLDTINWTAN